MSDETEHDGRSPIERPGFNYLPRFISLEEADVLAAYFASIHPLWEHRHAETDHARDGVGRRRLTRPVYWLGAWQFACLGYYAEPDHREHRCMRAEPLPAVMQSLLERLRPVLHTHDPAFPDPPNSCLVNYYGKEIHESGPPVDYARLRKHRDGEPGPVVMISIGQAGLLEFVDVAREDEVALGVWTRHRSISVLSGPEFKDRLYHRIRRVRHGQKPTLTTQLEGFDVRRISVSFRHVPADLIEDFGQLPAESRERIRPYVETLAEHSPHFRAQLEE